MTTDHRAGEDVSDSRAFVEGATYSYLSTSSMRTVTWTRDAQGVWTCDDGRPMTADDEYVAEQMALDEADL